MITEKDNLQDSQLDNLQKKIKNLFAVGKTQLAIEEALNLLSYSPDNSFALYYLAKSYLNLGDFKEAENYTLRLLEKLPDSDEAHGLYSYILSNMKRSKLAIEHSEKAVEINPNNPSNHYSLACSLEKLMRSSNREYVKRAIVAMEKALSLDSNNEYFHCLMSALYIEDGLYELGDKECEIALNINSQNAAVYVNYGANKVYLGKPELAEKLILKALELDPNISSAHQNRKLLLRINKKPKSYYKFLENHFFKHDLKYSKDSRSFLYLVNLLIERKRYGHALRILKRFLLLSPNNVNEHVNYAVILYDAGALSETLYYLEAVKRFNPKETSLELEKAIENVTNEIKQKGLKKLRNYKRYTYFAAVIAVIFADIVLLSKLYPILMVIILFFIFIKTMRLSAKGEFL